ncbi:PHP domain protein [Desulfofarcimen acetoxidans DSM 771]|uniref:PHP domain protein n=1 Tax=Desulfofarcimen acetoxidans (strain ATCC 49208 / DSM 771 / KCTC 5769 / VKM B-1644 / 5575) TaxID=485916 RepID=C8VYN8_DESAS|nr:PHP domain-containing protein [Desulfofarcimen acetoxidans]ACV64759.1 PHP domain protein [Desulfofarcimen acetoxidans DSM 771]
MQLEQILKIGNFDLHIHTTASDGVYTPSDIVQKAYGLGLKTIAITDHDTMSGVKEAVEAGKELGIKVIPGVELSAKHKGKSVDVLGYNIFENMELNEILVQLNEGREARALRIINKFKELNMSITIEDVREFSGEGNIGRPHIAKAIVKNGFVSDIQTVFDKYLADGKPAAIDKLIIKPQKAIELIHNAGGLAVLAHPVLIGDDDLVRELLDLNFDGIEVWHRKQDKEDNKRYKKIAEEFGLLMTGGSDFHNDEHSLGQFGIDW